MSQVLRNVAFEDECYTIVFINVPSHTGELFAFLNKQDDRLEFHWNKWGEWRDLLQPYSCHAFLIHGWSSNTPSGMNFRPVMHLCSFLNIQEARTFNAAYLLSYNKLLDECNVEEINALSLRFSDALMNMQEMREHWVDLCSKAAHAIMNTELFEAFGMEYPDVRALHRPWEADIPVDGWEFYDFRDDE